LETASYVFKPNIPFVEFGAEAFTNFEDFRIGEDEGVRTGQQEIQILLGTAQTLTRVSTMT